jgi:beta-ketoacyl ACP synthase
MSQLLTSGAAKPGDLALLIGYGAGLSYAAQVVRMPAASDA